MVCATSKGSDQPAHTHSLLSLEYYMNIKLLNEHNLEKATQIRLSLFMSKCHIVGNHMSRLICHSIRSNNDELFIFKIFLKVSHRIRGNRKR